MDKNELKGESGLTEGQSSWTVTCPQVGVHNVGVEWLSRGT